MILYFIILFAFCSCQQDGILLIQTPNFPKPYSGQLSWKERVDVGDGQGIAVVFEQFLASAHDCVIACPMNDDACSSICGDAMDHGLIPKILRVPGQTAFLAMVSTEKNDGFPHSGISAKVLTYDLVRNSFFDCGGVVDVSNGETYYFISQNYPISPTSEYLNCTMSFKTSNTRKGIRFAVYDFYSDSVFVIKDKENVVEISDFATEDEPLVYYFEDQADVIFSFSETHRFYEKRFYILVNSYEVSPNSSSNCRSVGNYVMKIGEIVNFGTYGFSDDVYGNNLNCNYMFTRHSSNSIFALSIQYETEKCCDTMNVDGLSKYEEIYQGFQSSNLFLSKSENISFSFLSDAVVGATGFDATIQHLDCTCPPDMYLEANGVLTSTGFNDGAIAYCPSLNCITKIFFDQSKHDLLISILKLDLRSYTQSDDLDNISILDAYNTSIAYMNPNYLGFESFLATVSPSSVQFMSTNLTSLPLSQSGKGFSFNLGLFQKKVAVEEITFTDDYYFHDISNLDLNSTTTFEYRIRARKGHKVFVYFFTPIKEHMLLDMFDGDNSTSPLIDNRVVRFANFTQGNPILMQSTSENAILRFRSNPNYVNTKLDFQALITDVSSDCGDLVYSLNLGETSDSITLQGQNCQKILHFTDSDYNQNSFMSLSFDTSEDVDVYFGLSKNHLIGKRKSALPPMIFSSYCLLEYSINTQETLNYYSQLWNNVFLTTISSNETLFLMSSDFLKTTSAATKHTFSVQLEASKSQNSVSIEFLANSGNSEISLDWEKMFGGTVTKEILKNVASNATFEYCGDHIWITYESPAGSDNGLYVRISQGDLQCSSGYVRVVTLSLVILFSTFLIDISV